MNMNMTTRNIKSMIQCDIQKVWETILAIEHYPAWRSDVSETEWIDEKQFIEHSPNGYSTTSKITLVKPNKYLELDVENSHTKGHWIIALMPQGSETEIDFTAGVTAKKLSMRPVGKSVFEQTYLKKEQAQFVTDLKKYLDGQLPV